MKKMVLVLLSLAMLLGCTGCISDKNDMVVEATVTLEQFWENLYQEQGMGDGYFEIKNTREIKIKENTIEEFKDIRCIIEFDLYADYFGTAPYYQRQSQHNQVVVHHDGSMEVKSNWIDLYRNKYYVTDCSEFLESVEDYNDEYNCVKFLK